MPAERRLEVDERRRRLLELGAEHRDIERTQLLALLRGTPLGAVAAAGAAGLPDP